MNLYELTQEFEELQYLIMSEDEEEALEAWDKLTITEEQIADKAEAYARMMKNLAAEAEAYKAEADRLTKLRKSRENAVERLKTMMHDAMVVMGKDKMPTSIGKFSLQKNPPSCKIYDQSKIPEEYWIPQDPKLDGKGIIEHYKATGEQLAGVDVIQELGLRFR